MDTPLQETLRDAVLFLDKHGIAYALIGGLAASLRGQPRVTADVDLVIGVGVEEALSLISNLDKSEFEPLFEGIEEVVQQAFILPLRHRGTRVKLDLSLGLSGFEQQVIARAQVMDILGESICLASAEDLLVMKLLAGRPRDNQDAEGIALVQGEQLDWDYCRETAKQLGEAVDQDLVGSVGKLKSEFGPGG